jgi:DNA-binding MarR family transcriptional regulator
MISKLNESAATNRQSLWGDLLTMLASKNEQFSERAYARLKAEVVRCMVTRQTTGVSELIKIIKHTAAQCRAQGDPEHAAFLTAYADLLIDWKHLQNEHSADKLAARPFVLEILSALSEEPDASMFRRDLGERIGLGEANLSRLLGTMEIAGLIVRQSRNSKTISITQEGRNLARRQSKN